MPGDRVARLVLDDPEAPLNLLSSRVLLWLGQQVERLEEAAAAGRIDGVLLLSGKPGVFVAGGDLQEMITWAGAAADTSAEGLSPEAAVDAAVEVVVPYLLAAHDLTLRLEALPVPVVAAIEGACLGGGLELALAAHGRVAADTPKTRLGLPEVQLGLVPGMGGTQRLPRLLGVPAALDLLLTGRRIDPHRALALGLVDEVCHRADLERVALDRLESLADRWRQARSLGGFGALRQRLRDRQEGLGVPWRRRLTDGVARLPGVGGALIYRRARRRVAAMPGVGSGPQYPAPRVAIALVEEGFAMPLRRALAYEAGAFSRLLVSPTAQNLIGLFFRRQRLEAAARKTARGARKVRTVGVLGAGLMGSGIAQVLVREGFEVVLGDRDWAALGRAVQGLARSLGRRVDRGKMSDAERGRAQARLHTVHLEGGSRGAALEAGDPRHRAPKDPLARFRRTDLVIEAVYEDLEVKGDLLRRLEGAGSGGPGPEGPGSEGPGSQGPGSQGPGVFASNTSTLPIGRLAEASRRPERVVGMHFFSPVPRMPLLEVIRHRGPAGDGVGETSEEALATAVAVGLRMGKTPIVVEDGPGFLTTRILAPYLNEAAWLLQGGAMVEEVDRALTAWGWPMGPFELLDQVGLDIAHHVSEVLAEALGERLAPPPLFTRMLEDGRLGTKVGKGFYDMELGAGEGSAGDRSADLAVYELLDWERREVSDQEIVERCWLQMASEAVRVLDEGKVEGPEVVDLAVVLGFGFPPFRGGLLQELDRRGAAWAVERLEHYAGRYGDRLTPAPGLVERAREGRRFYP